MDSPESNDLARTEGNEFASTCGGPAATLPDVRPTLARVARVRFSGPTFRVARNRPRVGATAPRSGRVTRGMRAQPMEAKMEAAECIHGRTIADAGERGNGRNTAVG